MYLEILGHDNRLGPQDSLGSAETAKLLEKIMAPGSTVYLNGCNSNNTAEHLSSQRPNVIFKRDVSATALGGKEK